MAHIVMLGSVLLSMVRRNKRKFLGLSFLILIVFSCIRYDFGNDYMSYFRHFENIKAGYNYFTKELLYAALNTVAPNYYILIAITSILTIFPVYKIITKYVNPNEMWIAVLIYCVNPYLFLMSLSAIRQSLATTCFIIAIVFSYRHKPVSYIFTLIVACLFHRSAIVLLPFYFWANDRKVTVAQVWIIIGILFALLISSSLLNNILEWFLAFLDDTSYENYFSQQTTNTLRATLLSSFFLVYVLLNLPRLDGYTLLFTKLYLVGCVFSVLAFRLSMLTRIQMYFDVFSVVSIPMLISFNRNLRKKSIYTILVRYVLPLLMFTVYFLRYYSFYTNPLWEPFFEYRTIFEVM